MRFRTVLAVLTFGLPTIGFGQSFDPCKTGTNAAELAISSGTVYFPRLTIKSSYTLRKMLELEYGIKDDIYDNGSDLSFEGEVECFFKVMKNEIDKRWGKNFLKDQRQIANSLDRDGLGYKEPRENGIADTLSHYLKHEHPLDLANKNYLVKIKISGNKDIVDIGVLSGLPYATEISRDLDDYQFIRDAIYKVDKVYEPGQLRGKTVESTLTFWIELGK
jgi:hypothetical protein